MIQGSCLCGSARWQFEGEPDGATACNCTACRRYGVLWAYDYDGEGIKVAGKTQPYIRGEAIEFHLDGLREDGSPIPPPSSKVEYVEVAA